MERQTLPRLLCQSFTHQFTYIDNPNVTRPLTSQIGYQDSLSDVADYEDWARVPVGLIDGGCFGIAPTFGALQVAILIIYQWVA